MEWSYAVSVCTVTVTLPSELVFVLVITPWVQSSWLVHSVKPTMVRFDSTCRSITVRQS